MNSDLRHVKQPIECAFDRKQITATRCRLLRRDVFGLVEKVTLSGAPGVDGQRFEDLEAYGVEKWLGELAQDDDRRRHGRHRGLLSDLRSCIGAAVVVDEISLAYGWVRKNSTRRVRLRAKNAAAL